MNTTQFNPTTTKPTRLSTLRENFELAAHRITSRHNRPRFAYISGQGDANLGDEAILEAAVKLYPDVDMIPYTYPRQEQRWTRFGLSGQKYFSAAVLSGGTLINSHWILQARMALDQGLPMFTLGTGVGSPDVNIPDPVDVAPWKPLLDQFTHIGLRGPLSQAKLEAIGIKKSVVIGDLAFALTPAVIAPPPAAKRYILDLHLLGSASYNAGTFSTLEHIPAMVVELAKLGWEPVPVAMHRKDIQATHQVLENTEWVDTPVVLQETSEQYFTSLSDCSFSVSTRLHASILSACVGVLPVLLSTVDKCMDFMESMQIAPFALDCGQSSYEQLLDRVMVAAESAGKMRGVLHSCALDYKSRIEAYAADTQGI